MFALSALDLKRARQSLPEMHEVLIEVSSIYGTVKDSELS
jgi:hypothetical protein